MKYLEILKEKAENSELSGETKEEGENTCPPLLNEMQLKMAPSPGKQLKFFVVYYPLPNHRNHNTVEKIVVQVI